MTRHPKLQRFMLANDSATISVEVPIWLREDDITTLEEIYGLSIVSKEPIARGSHKPRFITGHVDFLKARNGAIHILTSSPPRTNKPIAEVTILCPRADAPHTHPELFDNSR